MRKIFDNPWIMFGGLILFFVLFVVVFHFGQTGPSLKDLEEKGQIVSKKDTTIVINDSITK